MFFAEEKIEREKELLVTFSPHINVLSYIEQRKREKRTSSHTELSHQCYLNTEQRKRETRPSILCVTQKRAFMPLYIVLGQQRACMPVYIGKSGDLVG